MKAISAAPARELASKSLGSLILEMHAQYRRALEADAIPATPRWREFCQQQWQQRQTREH